MKVLYLLILIKMVIFSITAQSLLVPDTATLMRPYESYQVVFFGRVDNQTVKIKPKRSQLEFGPSSDWTTFLYIDSLITDSLPAYFYFDKKIHIYDRPTIIGSLENYQGEQKLKYKTDLASGKFEFVDSTQHFFNYMDGELYGGSLIEAKYDGYGDYISIVNSFNIVNKSIEPIYEFDSDPEKAEGVIDILTFPDKKELLIGRAYCYIDFSECDSAEIYKINISDRSTEFYDNSYFQNIDRFYLNTNQYLLRRARSYGNDFIINDQNRKVTEVLPRKLELLGWNYQNGKLTSHNFKSRTDEKPNWAPRFSEVIIPYRFTLRMERSLYRIYNNEIMFKEDTDKLDLYDLLILKNMVFAKHNYGFENRFYQAFFNLFGFYGTGEKRKNRTKEVNHLLSLADQINLKIINAKLERYGN